MVTNLLDHLKLPTMMTTEARNKGLRDDDDNSVSFHSTCAADKALGQQ
jgi:hypothetical protein